MNQSTLEEEGYNASLNTTSLSESSFSINANESETETISSYDDEDEKSEDDNFRSNFKQYTNKTHDNKTWEAAK